MTDNQSKKEETKRLHLEQRNYEQRVIEQYVSGSEINLHELPLVEPHIRKLLLSWIGKAVMREDRTIKTEYGTKVQVTIDPHETVVLKSKDGTLEMPNVRFRFIREEVKA